MKPGQRLTRWWQRVVLGELATPQDICAAALQEEPSAAQAGDRFFQTPDDGLVWDIPKRLSVAPSFFTGLTYLRQSERADWQHANPALQRWAALFIEYARKRGVPLYVHCCFRGEAEQNEANQKGNSKAPYPRSAHNIAEAVDIVHSVYHWDLTPKEWQFLQVLAQLALNRVNATLPSGPIYNEQGQRVGWSQPKLALVWGGTFTSIYDPAHWEVADYRNRTRRLAAGPPLRQTPRHILARVKL